MKDRSHYPAQPLEAFTEHPTIFYVNAKKCAGKWWYASKGQAKQAAKQHRARFGTVSRPYRCQICGNYHLTKKPKEREEADQ